MSKSIGQINKEIEKEKYYETPMGQIEKELRRIYKAIENKEIVLTDEQKAHIDTLRKENGQEIEKANEEYGDELRGLQQAFTDKKKEAETGIDVLAVSLMNKEVEYLQSIEKDHGHTR